MKYFMSLVIPVLLTGCTTALTKAAQDVRVVGSVADSCEFLGRVSESEGWGFLPSGNTEAATNKAINKTAQYGGNVLKLTGSVEGGSRSYVNGEAYRCRSASDASAANLPSTVPESGSSVNYAPMQNFANFVIEKPTTQPTQTNCETVPVRDMYSNKVMSYRTQCHLSDR